MSKDLKKINLLDLVPHHLKSDQNIIAASQAIEVMLQDIADQSEKCLLLPRLNELEEPILDSLAWQYHVDFYEPIGLTIDKKRELIRKSIDWHRHKGTPAAVEEIIEVIFGKGYVKEWFEYSGRPYFFKIGTTGTLKGEEEYKQLISAIYSVKNTRSWLELIELEHFASLTIYTGIADILSGTSTILPRAPDMDSKMVMRFGIAKRLSGNTAIRTPPIASSKAQLSIGGIITHGGWHTIQANTDDLPQFEEFMAQLVLRSGIAQARGGTRAIYLSALPDASIQTRIGGAVALQTGRQSILPACLPAARQSVCAGCAVIKSGNIIIKEVKN